jgi:hypothetical protein
MHHSISSHMRYPEKVEDFTISSHAPRALSNSRSIANEFESQRALRVHRRLPQVRAAQAVASSELAICGRKTFVLRARVSKWDHACVHL